MVYLKNQFLKYIGNSSNTNSADATAYCSRIFAMFQDHQFFPHYSAFGKTAEIKLKFPSVTQPSSIISCKQYAIMGHLPNKIVEVLSESLKYLRVLTVVSPFCAGK